MRGLRKENHKYDLVQPGYKARVLTGLTHGDYICGCPRCGDGVMIEDDDYGGMMIRCQGCGTEAAGEYEMSRKEARKQFKHVICEKGDIIIE